MIRGRDEKGLGILYDQYAPTLLGLIFNIVRDKETAEEILQKTCLKIWNNIDQYDSGKSRFFTWMAAIARNTAIDKKRLVSFQNREKTDSLDKDVHNIQTVQHTSSSIDVDALLSKMDPKYKLVLDHIYLMGYSQRETAELLDIPLGTIKTRVKAAIEILRNELKNEKSLFLGLLLIGLILLLVI